MRRRWIRISLAVLVAAALFVALRFTLFRPDPVPVTVFRVARGSVEDTVTNSKAGTIESRRRAMVSPEIGGRVVELGVREGQEVREGQVLLRLADGDLRARVALQQRALATARAVEQEACLAAQHAQREHERYVRLSQDDLVSPELLDQLANNRNVAAAACESARARVLEGEASLDVARAELGKTVVRAPFDGLVAEVSTELGEWITPSPPGLPIPAVIELLQPSSTYVSAPLDEVDVARIRDGQPVRITLDAYPGRDDRGHVSRVAPYVLDVEEHSRTFEIEVDFADEEFARTLLPGTSADVEVILAAKENVLRIPSYALIEGKRVLVVGPDSRLVSRSVETGLANWAFTEITSGLAEGEQVVVSLDRAEVAPGAWVAITGETER